jgi:VanZ family protein
VVGLLLTMIPPAIGRVSGRHVPWMLELPFVLGVTIQFVSESFNIVEWFAIWDKLAHFGEILLATILAAFLVLGYRELRGLEIPDGLAVAGLVCFGISLGAVWEIVEFGIDQLVAQTLQTSNRGTVLDLLADSLGALTGVRVALRLYRRAPPHQREGCGAVAAWLARPPGVPGP